MTENASNSFSRKIEKIVFPKNAGKNASIIEKGLERVLPHIPDLTEEKTIFARKNFSLQTTVKTLKNIL